MTDHKTRNKNGGQTAAEGPTTSTLADKPVVAERGRALRFLKTLIIVFVIVLAGLFAVAYFSGGDRASLPFAYEGFD